MDVLNSVVMRENDYNSDDEVKSTESEDCGEGGSSVHAVAQTRFM